MASINAVLTAENGDDLYPETYDDYVLDSNGEALSTRLGSRSEASGVSGTSAFEKINTLSSDLTDVKLHIAAESFGGTTNDTISVAVYNGTSSLIDNAIIVTHDDDYIFIKGMIRIRGFSRTDRNPGIVVTIPSGVTTSVSRNAYGIVSNLNPSEYITLAVSAGENKITLITSENFANAQSGTWIMCIPPMAIKR